LAAATISKKVEVTSEISDELKSINYAWAEVMHEWEHDVYKFKPNNNLLQSLQNVTLYFNNFVESKSSQPSLGAPDHLPIVHHPERVARWVRWNAFLRTIPDKVGDSTPISSVYW
jgi:hypothetical protein